MYGLSVFARSIVLSLPSIRTDNRGSVVITIKKRKEKKKAIQVNLKINSSFGEFNL